MPRSKPSMTTYIISPKAMISTQISERSSAHPGHSPAPQVPDRYRAPRTAAGRVALQGSSLSGGGARAPFGPLRDQFQQIGNAGAEHRAVDDDKHQQADAHGQGGMVRHGVGGPHHAIDHPGLAADLGGHPAGEDGDDAGRPHRHGEAQEQPLWYSRPRQRSQAPPMPSSSISMPRPTITRKVQKMIVALGRSCGGESFRPLIWPSQLWVRIRLPEMRDLDRVEGLSAAPCRASRTGSAARPRRACSTSALPSRRSWRAGIAAC